MRLSRVLSNEPSENFDEVDGFLPQKVLKKGAQRKVDIGNVALEFFCEECTQMRTFRSRKASYCLGIDKKFVSVTSLLACTQCEQKEVLVWFLLEGKGSLHVPSPSVKIVKRGIKLFSGVKFSKKSYDELSELFNKAEACYYEELGFGAVMYLRIILEKIINQVADTLEISRRGKKGGFMRFRTILDKVDSKQSILPVHLRKDGYRLFSEMSEIVHGRSTEEEALRKFNSLKELVNSVLKTVEVNEITSEAIEKLGWKFNGETDE